MNILTTKVELFAIRCGISQSSQIQDITHIIVITNTIYTAKYIFDIFIYSYKLYYIIISSDLNKNTNNAISF